MPRYIPIQDDVQIQGSAEDLLASADNDLVSRSSTDPRTRVTKADFRSVRLQYHSGLSFLVFKVSLKETLSHTNPDVIGEPRAWNVLFYVVPFNRGTRFLSEDTRKRMLRNIL